MVLTLKDGSSFVLSFCPKASMPWPLRGSQRWSETDAVIVDGRPISIHELTAVLDLIWQKAEARHALVDYCIIAQEIERRSLTLSDSEQQELLDQFRQRRNLADKGQTDEWLQRNGYTLDTLIESLSFTGLQRKLEHLIAAERRESFDKAKLSALDEIFIARISMKSESDAVAFCQQLGIRPSL